MGRKSKSKESVKISIGDTSSNAHGHSGRNNKMRYLFDADNKSYLAVSSSGDVIKWSKAKKRVLTPLHADSSAKDTVDACDCSEDGTLVLGYLAAQPKSQIGFYHSTDSRPQLQTFDRSDANAWPHLDGGVSAVAAISGKRALSAGVDKCIYLWRLDDGAVGMRKAETDKISANHTSGISTLRPYDDGKKFMSGGADRRLFAYDLKTRQSFWQFRQPGPVVQILLHPSLPSVFLTSESTAVNQFSFVDIRAPTTEIFPRWGIALAPVASGANAGRPSTLSKFSRGSFIDANTFVHPDGANGVVIFDLRKLKLNKTKLQKLPNVGRSKVYHSFFERSEKNPKLLLLEATNMVVADVRFG